MVTTGSSGGSNTDCQSPVGGARVLRANDTTAFRPFHLAVALRVVRCYTARDCVTGGAKVSQFGEHEGSSSVSVNKIRHAENREQLR